MASLSREPHTPLRSPSGVALSCVRVKQDHDTIVLLLCQGFYVAFCSVTLDFFLRDAGLKTPCKWTF